MALTKEQSLIPRYKVKDKYPGMEAEPFRLGQIITLQWHKEVDGDDFAEGFIHVPIKHIPGSFMWQSFFDLFPNIFEPLPWWSDRKPEGMPEYMRVIRTINGVDNVGVVFRAEPGAYNKYMAYGFTTDNAGNCTGFDNVILGAFEPSNLEEYTAHINQKQQ